MAKTGIGEHTKTIALAVELDIPECYAVGVLECFWQFVAREAPDGDVTGHKPSLVARRIRFPGKGEDLFAALIASGFLDDENGRILVHDWSEHATDSVHTHLFRAVQRFADGTKPKPAKVGRDEKERLETRWGSEPPETTPPAPAGNPDSPAGDPAGEDTDHAGSRRGPAGVPTLPNPSLPYQALDTEPTVPTLVPQTLVFERVRETLWAVADALGDPRPNDASVRRSLPPQRGLVPLLERIEPAEAAEIYLWCGRHFPGGRSWVVIGDHLSIYRNQMREGIANVPRQGAPPGSSLAKPVPPSNRERFENVAALIDKAS